MSNAEVPRICTHHPRANIITEWVLIALVEGSCVCAPVPSSCSLLDPACSLYMLHAKSAFQLKKTLLVCMPRFAYSGPNI